MHGSFPLRPACWPLVVVLLLLASLPTAAGGAVHAAQAPNTWSVTGAMSTGRVGATATLLGNGKVLVAGGIGINNPVNSADLYDPATGTFTPTGAMTSPRSGHTATLLPNGQVLITGGADPNRVLASAELYDPATGTFTATGAMTSPRTYHTATLLPNGQVLVAGGLSTLRAVTATAELYDPTTGTFTTTGAMSTARLAHAATLLPNGQVLIAGGCASISPGSCGLADAELYNPTTGTWSATGSMNSPRGTLTLTLLQTGKVLAAGGVARAELYDPGAGTWAYTGSMSVVRGGNTATLLPNGQVLVAGGGSCYGGCFLASAEVYNPANGVWSLTGSLSTSRLQAVAALLPDGRVLVAGGCGGNYINNCVNQLASAEVYLPGSSAFVRLGATSVNFGNQPINTTSVTSTVNLTNTGVLPLTVSGVAVGGANATDFATATACTTAPIAPGGHCAIQLSFNPRAFQNRAASVTITDTAPNSPQSIALSGFGADPRWTPISGTVNFGYLVSAVLLANGNVLILSEGTTNATLYNPASGTFTPTGSMTTPRTQPALVRLKSGKILVMGGCPQAGGCTSAELYDPASGTFTATGSMTTPRANFTATLLPNGQVLVAGGCNVVGCGYAGIPADSLSSAELYDPATGTFTPTGSLSTARGGATATLLPNGQVLVAGGEFCTSTPFPGFCGSQFSTELYNPATDAFTPGPGMSTARAFHAAALLPSGRVLLAGGINESYNIVASAEIYNPTTNTFSPTGAMTTPRYGGTSLLASAALPNGQVLIMAGDGCGLSNSTDLYNALTGTWAGGTLNVGRCYVAGVTLPNGQVFATGDVVSGAPPAEVYTPAVAVANPGSASVGQSLTVTGAHFIANETITLAWDTLSAPLTTTTTTATGTFSAHITVPSTGAGVHTVLALGQTSGSLASAHITVH